jgi:hypothetical protein
VIPSASSAPNPNLNMVLKNSFCANYIVSKLLIINGHFSAIFAKHGCFNTLLIVILFTTKRLGVRLGFMAVFGGIRPIPQGAK